MTHTIIEFKAKCSDLTRLRRLLQHKQARAAGRDHQVDTYFRVPEGRLKLREGNIENALVFYRRADQQGPKQSNVNLSPVAPGSGLKETLNAALGVLAVVDKQREIYFVENVKIHLDEVQGLGSFVEVEAIGVEEEVEKLRTQCEEYRRVFGVRDEDLVARSYGDLVLGNA